MAFSISPAVTITETDLSAIIPNVAQGTAAMSGQFTWGPVEDIQYIDTESQLVNVFGKPSTTVYTDFLCGASFLAYSSNLAVVRVVASGARNATGSVSVGTSGQLIKNQTVYEATDFSGGTDLWVAKYPGVLGNSIGVAWADTTGYNSQDSAGEYVWPWRDLFTDAPASNEFHIVIYDATGNITGTTDTAIERHAFVSSTSTALAADGTSAYFKEVINRKSNWLFVAKASLLTGDNDGFALAGGLDGAAISEGNRQTGYALFLDTEEVDVALVFAAGGGLSTMQYILEDLAEVRRDCVAFLSPLSTDVVNVLSPTDALENVLTTRTSIGSSNGGFGFMDSAYKLMYDRYNDVNRWVPLNGDCAGLMSKTSNDLDAWWSPAGLNRGLFKNCQKLSWKQDKTIRDKLYASGVNPCVIFKNVGPVLLGDKTLQTRPSAFDRINVRMLFNVIEKAIATAAKYYLFEFNNPFTRSRFRNQLIPYLKDIQGRQGIDKFEVICDETNNTPQVISSNEFVATIFIVPVYSINAINLNFVAMKTGTNFDEQVVTLNNNSNG